MEDSKKGKSQVEQTAIDEDIVFMKSMMTDRAAQYSVCDKITPIIEKRYVKAQKAEKRALNKKRKFEEISEKFDSDSEPEDKDKDDYLTPPSVRSYYKRTVKMGTTLKVSQDILKSPD